MADQDYQIGQDIHELRARCSSLEVSLIEAQLWRETADALRADVMALRDDLESLRVHTHEPAEPVEPAPEDVPPEPDEVPEEDPKAPTEVAPDRTSFWHRKLGTQRDQ